MGFSAEATFACALLTALSILFVGFELTCRDKLEFIDERFQRMRSEE